MANLLQQYRETFPEFREMDDAQLTDALYEKYAGKESKTEKADFALMLKGRGPRIGAYEASKERLKGSVETGIARLLQGVGAEEKAADWAESAQERREDVEARYQPRIRGYEDVKSIADVPEYAGQLIAGSAPQTGLGLAGAGVGALASRLPFLRPFVSRGAGALVGGGAATYPAYFGSNIERQMEEGRPFEETDAGSAALAALGQSALDAASLGVLFKGIPGLDGLSAKAQATRIGRAATRAVETGVTEALTETGQQSLEIMQATPEKFFSFTPEVQKELIESAIGGGLVGGLLGGAAGAVSRRPRLNNCQLPEPSPRQAQSLLMGSP